MKKMWTTDWYMLVGVGVCLGTRSTFINPDQFRDSKIQFVWKTEQKLTCSSITPEPFVTGCWAGWGGWSATLLKQVPLIKEGNFGNGVSKLWIQFFKIIYHLISQCVKTHLWLLWGQFLISSTALLWADNGCIQAFPFVPSSDEYW